MLNLIRRQSLVQTGHVTVKGAENWGPAEAPGPSRRSVFIGQITSELSQDGRRPAGPATSAGESGTGSDGSPRPATQ